MFSSKVKFYIAEKVQELLQSIDDEELPDGEINFVLHVDGKTVLSWANIVNNGRNQVYIPSTFIRNTSS